MSTFTTHDATGLWSRPTPAPVGKGQGNGNVSLSEIISKYILYLGLHEKDKNHGPIYFLVDENDFYILSHKYRSK